MASNAERAAWDADMTIALSDPLPFDEIAPPGGMDSETAELQWDLEMIGGMHPLDVAQGHELHYLCLQTWRIGQLLEELVARLATDE